MMNYLGLDKFYSGKRVFITGHTGFKGGWLLAWLHKLGANVKGYALEPESSDGIYTQINGDERCESVIGNVVDANTLVNEITEFKPDVIFHLAAQPLVRNSYLDPLETFNTNIIGTANLLNAVRKLENKCISICITTDKVYKNLEWYYPYREVDELGGKDPYSASKAASELVIDSFRQSYFHQNTYPEHQKSIASARAGNVIGGGDWAKDRLIPDIVRALQNEEIIKLRNPQSVRPWQHVLESIGAYLYLARRMWAEPTLYNESWNFGPNAGDTLSVEELTKLTVHHWGEGAYQRLEQNSSLREANLLMLDISQAKRKLDWSPKLTASEAIIYTIDWYKAKDKEAITFKQINEFEGE